MKKAVPTLKYCGYFWKTPCEAPFLMMTWSSELFVDCKVHILVYVFTIWSQSFLGVCKPLNQESDNRVNVFKSIPLIKVLLNGTHSPEVDSLCHLFF